MVLLFLSKDQIFFGYLNISYDKYANSAEKNISQEYRNALAHYCGKKSISSCSRSTICQIGQMDCPSGCIPYCDGSYKPYIIPKNTLLMRAINIYPKIDRTLIDPECKGSEQWERRGSFYIKDNYVCLRAKRYYSEIDGRSFEYLNHTYAKDKNHIFVFDDFKDEYGTKAQILDADVATFEPIGHYTVYAKDKNHVYGCGRIISDADIDTFEYLSDSSGFAKDKNYVYRDPGSLSELRIPNCTVGMIKDANPETFNVKEYQKKNKNNYTHDDLMFYL